MTERAQSTPAHWDAAYAAGDTTRGWYQSSATESMRIIESIGLPHTASIVDVGAGASVLVDDLVAAGFSDITLVDHSPIGLAVARQRLGVAAATVHFVDADLLAWEPDRTYDLWHDRAVLHFLLEDAAVEGYRSTLLAATAVGSVVIIGVFGPEGPPMCAGLPVRRYDVAAINSALGPRFEVQSTHLADHVRPDGDTQQYLWTLARRTR